MKIKGILFCFLLLSPFPCRAQYMNLDQVITQFGASIEWNPVLEVGYIDIETEIRREDRIIFKPGSPWVIINYKKLIPTTGIVRKNGAFLFPEETIKQIKKHFINRKEEEKQHRVAAIIIDPGHGGKDPGALRTHVVDGKKKTLHEKDIVLKVSVYLYSLLKKKYPYKRILLTRTDDTYLYLEERTNIANNISLKDNEAIIYLSIHANASLNKNAKGFEVWYLSSDYRRNLVNPDSVEDREIVPILNVLREEEYLIESILLAKEVLAGFDKYVGESTENRGIKEEAWFVVRNAKMPSILIELGFITNYDEAVLLMQDEYLQKLSLGIYNGIQNFVYNFENTKGFTE